MIIKTGQPQPSSIDRDKYGEKEKSEGFKNPIP